MAEIWDLGSNPHGAEGVYYDDVDGSRISVAEALSQIQQSLSDFIPFARCSFDGTAAEPTPVQGFNVDSITKNATGDYTITFTTAGAVSTKQVFITVNAVGFGSKVAESTTAVQIQTHDGSADIDTIGTLVDFSSVDIVVFD